LKKNEKEIREKRRFEGGKSNKNWKENEILRKRIAVVL